MNKLLVTMLCVFFMSPVFADIDESLPDFGEPWDAEIPFSSIWDEFTEGNFEKAWAWLQYEVYRQAEETWNDEATWARIAAWGGKKLEEVLSEEGKTDKEKGAEIANMIAATIEPYSNQENSALNVKVEHSILYETTFITWNDMVKTDECAYYYFEWQCDETGQCIQIYTYGEDFLVQVPDYNIYRIVNGHEKLITTIKGSKRIYPNRITVGGSWTDFFSDAYHYNEISDKFPGAGERLVWEDPHAGHRSVGETLSYKVVADNSAYDANSCGYNDQWEGFVIADSDGDKRMDYIPDQVYSSVFIRQAPWFIPVITMMY